MSNVAEKTTDKRKNRRTAVAGKDEEGAAVDLASKEVPSVCETRT